MKETDTAKFVAELRRWAGIAHDAWLQAERQESMTVHRAFFGVGIDHMLNAATLIELQGGSRDEGDAGGTASA